MNAPIVKVAVIIGLPEAIRGRIQAKFKGVVDIRPIPLARDGGYRLGMPHPHAKDLVEQFARAAGDLNMVALIPLPYHGKVHMVEDALNLLVQAGSRIYRAPPGGAWPKPRRAMDSEFQNSLIEQLCACLDDFAPEPEGEGEDDAVKFEILRGLATHSKMGENNHSHEDDLWKQRGRGLGSRGRERIVKDLMDRGILDRKKNKSKGGTGWVYWIADVQGACAAYPELAKYVG
jgi:hypothetical protein